MSMQMRRNAIDDKTTISTVEISGSSDFSANTKCLHMIKKLRLLYFKKIVFFVWDSQCCYLDAMSALFYTTKPLFINFTQIQRLHKLIRD